MTVRGQERAPLLYRPLLAASGRMFKCDQADDGLERRVEIAQAAERQSTRCWYRHVTDVEEATETKSM